MKINFDSSGALFLMIMIFLIVCILAIAPIRKKIIAKSYDNIRGLTDTVNPTIRLRKAYMKCRENQMQMLFDITQDSNFVYLSDSTNNDYITYSSLGDIK
jgi:hypothetical protein